MKIAYANRTSGNVYDVTYKHSRDMDISVPGEYLLLLIRKGYEVHCNNNGHGGEGFEIGRMRDGEIVWEKPANS